MNVQLLNSQKLAQLAITISTSPFAVCIEGRLSATLLRPLQCVMKVNCPKRILAYSHLYIHIRIFTITFLNEYPH